MKPKTQPIGFSDIFPKPAYQSVDRALSTPLTPAKAVVAATGAPRTHPACPKAGTVFALVSGQRDSLLKLKWMLKFQKAFVDAERK
jgi:hypothetical protein